jgi:ABC-2 type transport system permease protein
MITVTLRFMLAERRRALIGWTIGTVALVVAMAAVFPSIRDTAAELEAYVATLPEGLMDAFGLGGASIASPEGYLTSQLYSNMYPIVILIMGIGIATWAIAGSESDGTLEATLAAPVPRINLAIARFLGLAILTFIVTFVSTAALALIGIPLGLHDGIPAWGMWSAGLLMWAMVLLFSSFAFAIGAATGRRGAAITVATTVAVVTFLMQLIAALAEPLQWLRYASPWYWFLEPNPLVNAPSALSLLAPLLLAFGLCALGVFRFNSRDIAQ